VTFTQADIRRAVALLSRKQKRQQRTKTVYNWLAFTATRFALGGLYLMLLVPLAHEHLGTPAAHPAYWPSTALFTLASLVFTGLRPAPRTPAPTADGGKT
jgi:hypothetical protein